MNGIVKKFKTVVEIIPDCASILDLRYCNSPRPRQKKTLLGLGPCKINLWPSPAPAGLGIPGTLPPVDHWVYIMSIVKKTFSLGLSK